MGTALQSQPDGSATGFSKRKRKEKEMRWKGKSGRGGGWAKRKGDKMEE